MVGALADDAHWAAYTGSLRQEPQPAANSSSAAQSRSGSQDAGKRSPAFGGGDSPKEARPQNDAQSPQNDGRTRTPCARLVAWWIQFDGALRLSGRIDSSLLAFLWPCG